MKLTKILVAIIAPLITLVPQFTPIANAQSDSQIARGRCIVGIVGLEDRSRVNMRSAPGVESDIVGYVLVGQRVAQLYYGIAGDAPVVRESDGEGVFWDYVEYLPSQTRGWIASYLLDQSCSSRQSR